MLYGHTHDEIVAFGSRLVDRQDEAQSRRDRRGVVSTVGIDIPRPPGFLRRLRGR